jgi:hypothetical protein
MNLTPCCELDIENGFHKTLGEESEEPQSFFVRLWYVGYYVDSVPQVPKMDFIFLPLMMKESIFGRPSPTSKLLIISTKCLTLAPQGGLP